MVLFVLLQAENNNITRSLLILWRFNFVDSPDRESDCKHDVATVRSCGMLWTMGLLCVVEADFDGNCEA
jgi:hypothetical protein